MLAGASISPAVTVTVEDAQGNVVTGASGTITLGLTGSPAGVTLTGGGAATVTNGVATFAGLSVNKSGSYTFTPTTTVSGVATLPVTAVTCCTPSSTARSRCSRWCGSRGRQPRSMTM